MGLGCLIMICGVIVAWMAAAATSEALNSPPAGALVFIIIMAWAYFYGKKEVDQHLDQEKDAAEQAQINLFSDREVAKQTVSLPSTATLLTPPSDTKALYLDFLSKTMWIVEGKTPVGIPVSELLGVSLIGDKDEIYYSNTSGKVGMAAVGGLALGGIGAIIGTLLSEPDRQVGPCEIQIRYIQSGERKTETLPVLPKQIHANLARTELQRAQQIIESIEEWRRYVTSPTEPHTDNHPQ